MQYYAVALMYQLGMFLTPTQRTNLIDDINYMFSNDYSYIWDWYPAALALNAVGGSITDINALKTKISNLQNLDSLSSNYGAFADCWDCNSYYLDSTFRVINLLDVLNIPLQMLLIYLH
jgi:hypothetical protein